MAPLPLFPDLPDPAPPAVEPTGLRDALASLVEAGISTEHLLAVHRVYRGCVVYVPESVTEGHPLARALGLDAAAALCRVHRGHLAVPKRLYTGPALYALIRRDLDAGVHVHEICRRYDVTERTVWAAGGRG